MLRPAASVAPATSGNVRDDTDTAADANDPADAYAHLLRRVYLDLPTADGVPVHDPRVDDLRATVPLQVRVRHEDSRDLS